MSVTLTITGDTLAPQRFVVRAGEFAVVGRSEWADISLPAVASLADEQFRIDCHRIECVVQSLSDELLRNGKATTTSVLDHGDVLEAAGLRCEVQLNGLVRRPTTHNEPAPTSEYDQRAWFEQCLSGVRLSPAGEALVMSFDPLGTFDRLVADGLRDEACQFALACLPKPRAIQFVLEQMVEHVTLASSEAGELVAATDASSDARLPVSSVDARIAAAPKRSPEAWLWKAARWSTYLLSAEDCPPVRPAPHLFALALNVAMNLASIQAPSGTWTRWLAEARCELDNEVAVLFPAVAQRDEAAGDRTAFGDPVCH